MMKIKKVILPLKKIKVGSQSGWEIGGLRFISNDIEWLNKFKKIAIKELGLGKEYKKLK